MTDRKEYMKAWKEAHKESEKAKLKAWKEAHKESEKAKKKAWYEAHKQEHNAYMKAYKEAHKQELKEYKKTDVNSLGKTKTSIRMKSWHILKKMHLHIPRYEIHHAFGYDDPSKFIYISKSLHLKIHQYLRDNNISADTDHWQAISHIVNSTYEFIYIKS